MDVASNCLLNTYPYTSRSVSSHSSSENFLLHQMEVDREAHSKSKCKEMVPMEYLNLFGALYLCLPSSFIEYQRRKCGVDCKSQISRRIAWNSAFWTWHSHYIHELRAAAVAACRIPSQSVNIPAGMGKGITQKTSPLADSYWQLMAA